MTSVLSADVAVPNHAAQVRFYASILGSGDPPLWRPDLMNNQGMPVLGLGNRTGPFEKLPLQWMPHFQVQDIGASVQQAQHAGGQLVERGRGKDGRWLWAVLQDPDGAAFGLIGIVQDVPPLTADMGHIVGVELSVPDADAARAFYRAVLGTEPSIQTGTDRVWVVYANVADLVQSLERVGEGGGRVLRQDDGRAVIQDPEGIAFGLAQR